MAQSKPARYPSGSSEFARVCSIVDNTVVAAMTLLIVNIIVRRISAQDTDLADALAGHAGDLVAYAVTFGLVAMVWRAQHQLTLNLVAMDSAFVTATLLWMFFVGLGPVASVLVVEFSQYNSASVVYWTWLACLWGAFGLSSWIASRHGLLAVSYADLPHHHRVRGSVVRVVLFLAAAAVAAAAGGLAALAVVVPGLGVLWWLRWQSARTGGIDPVDEAA